MARSRNIKPAFFTNEELAEVSFETRILFIGLWTLADREGRLEYRPKKIKMALFPADSVDVDDMLTDLEVRNLIEMYEHDGIRCISIPKFLTHQSPHGTEKDSELPDKNGFYTRYARAKNGYVTGLPILSKELNLVVGELDNSALTVKAPAHNALIPDSCFLNPDSKEDTSAATCRVGDPVDNSLALSSGNQNKPLPQRTVQFSALLRKWEKERGKFSSCTSANPYIRTWAEAEVTDAQLREAYDLAVQDREFKGDDKSVNPGFIDAFLAKLLKPPEGVSALSRIASGASKPWQTTWSGIQAKGLELGIEQEAGELAPDYKDRVFAAAQMTEQEKSVLRADHGVSV